MTSHRRRRASLSRMPEPGRRCAKCGESFGAEVLYCPRDGSPLTSRKTELSEDPYVGLIIAGELRLDQLIGIGAMGRVYRAHEVGIERDVAVKILHRELLRNPMLVARFQREARAAARLAHPNVIGVHRLGELPDHGPNVGGETYLVLEYLDGISLRSALAAAGGALPLPRALHVILQVCDAVGDAHGRGIVHRDLKPDNVMLVRRGDDPDFVKVLDFGVARLSEGDRELATQAGAVLGTARYISPEGARGEPVGAPGDVYSITTMLFESLSGATPFEGESPVAILVKQTSEPAPDVRSLARASYLPEPIARVIAQNLSKDPGERCRDGRELGRTLVAAAHASGLKPEDLLPRSTLLGTRPALHLTSIERTKAMKLGAELEAKLHTPSPGPSGTAVIEADDAPIARASATPVVKSVDATLTEAEQDTLKLEPPRPEPRTSWLQRGGLIAACFAAGAVVALLAASSLGAFDAPAAGADNYVERAERALASGAIVGPPTDNVLDITDTALQRWPSQPRLLAVRNSAARTLVERARVAAESSPSEALELLRFASRLDPGNKDAQKLARELRSALEQVPPAAPSASAPLPSVARKNPKPSAAPVHSSAPAPSAVPTPVEATPESAPSARPAAESPGGRWL